MAEVGELRMIEASGPVVGSARPTLDGIAGAGSVRSMTPGSTSRSRGRRDPVAGSSSASEYLNISPLFPSSGRLRPIPKWVVGPPDSPDPARLLPLQPKPQPCTDPGTDPGRTADPPPSDRRARFPVPAQCQHVTVATVKGQPRGKSPGRVGDMGHTAPRTHRRPDGAGVTPSATLPRCRRSRCTWR